MKHSRSSKRKNSRNRSKRSNPFFSRNSKDSFFSQKNFFGPSGFFTPVIQMQEDEEPQAVVQNKEEDHSSRSVQMKNENNTGLPNHLKTGVENLSGLDLSDVNVHYNSSKPAQVNALAYTQGSDIYVGSGQEKHLPHEAWHVVQQRQGRVAPTKKIGNVNINDNTSLEKEADVMGKKATQGNHHQHNSNNNIPNSSPSSQKVAQRVDPISAASLGVAIFEAGRQMLTGGSFSSTSNTPSYMHTGTPASVKWKKYTAEAKIKAWHPRAGWGYQYFYFRISYEANGYDLRNVQVVPLKKKSSSMIASTFSIAWGGQAHSRPKDPKAAIIFNISGEWDPIGRGHVSFWGHLKVTQGGLSFLVDSEEWVSHAGIKYT